MTSTPLVSIVIRTKDRPDFLKQAIDSVLAQTYSNIQLIIVNDGGADISPVAEKVRERLSSLEIIQLEESVGRSSAANTGLELVKGEFVGFLDDDDWFEPLHIEQLINELNDSDSVLAYGNIESYSEDDQISRQHFGRSYDGTLLHIENYIPIHAPIFRSNVLEGDSKCRFDESFDLYEDWDFWLQVSRHGSFHWVDKLSGHYRVDGSSGIGVLASDAANVSKARNQIIAKWLPQFTVGEMEAIFALASFLTRENRIVDKRRHSLHLELDAMKQSEQLMKDHVSILNKEHERTAAEFKSLMEQKDRSIESLKEQQVRREDELFGRINQHVYQNALLDKDIEFWRIKAEEVEESHNKDIERWQAEIQEVENRLNKDVEFWRNLSEEVERNLNEDIISWQNKKEEVEKNLNAELAKSREELAAVYNSTSWKISVPLRVIKRILNRLRFVIRNYRQLAWQAALNIYRAPALSGGMKRIPVSWKQRLRNKLYVAPTNLEPNEIENGSTSENPKVSIIIPVYNHLQYLAQCIDSALGQTYENLEVVIYDDASPDAGVAQLLKSYEGRERCKVIYGKQNCGISEAQNKLLIASSGDVIGFLDCDDFLELDAVEKCMNAWSDTTAYLHTARVNIDSDGKEVSRICFEHLPREDYFSENLERMFATHFKMISRKAIAKVGLFDTRFDSAQDYDMLMRIAFHFPSESFKFLPQFVYHHRLHEKQTTESMNSEQMASTQTIQDEAQMRRSIQTGSFDKFISIIMLSFGKKEQTLEAIQSLEKTVKIDHEIILFDNGSDRGTVDFIKENIEGKFANLKVVYNERNLGPAGGRRAALDYASGDWFLVFDNDEIAEPGWIEELLVRAKSDPNIGAVCCKVVFPDNSLQFSGGFLDYRENSVVDLGLYDRGKNVYSLESSQFRDCDWCPIGATLFTVNPVEFLHEGYPNCFEDVGVSMSLRRMGKRLVNAPGAWVWHEHVMYQKKVDMHDRYLNDRYDPKKMMLSLKSFYKENQLIIHDEYVWRENNLNAMTPQEIANLLDA